MAISRNSWRRLALSALLGLGALAGCGGGDGGSAPVAPSGPPAVVIGIAGGTVTGPDGVTVEVPAGALATNTSLQITAVDSASVLPLPGGLVASDKVYNFLPHGTVFSVPAKLSIPRLAGDPTTGVSILKTNLDGSAWEQLVTATSATFHSAFITSFSAGRTITVRSCGPSTCSPPQPPPVITVQPVSGSVDEGGFVLLAVTAIGVQPLTYQWSLSTSGLLPGETTSAVVINPVTRALDGASLSVVVTDALGRTTPSVPALIRVRAIAPVIQSHPSSQTVTAGSTATFFASSTSSVAQDIRWERYNAATTMWDVVATQTAQLALPNVQVAADDQARFRFGATNAGTALPFVYSNVATLTVRPADSPVAITTQPVDVNTIGGRSASFQVFASGTNLTYDWWQSRFGGPFMSLGAAGSSATLTISNPTRADDGTRYFVIVGNSLGSVQSNIVTLSVASTNEALATRLSGGSFYSMFLADDGRLFAWGANDFGALGTGTFSAMEAPAPVTGLPAVATFAAGAEHALAVDGNGTVYAWGYNIGYALGDGTTVARSRPVTVDLGGTPARFVGAGVGHSFAATGGSTFLSWGTAYHGDGSYSALPMPTRIAPSFVALSSRSSDLSVGLRADGTVWTWGVNGEGGLGTGDQRARLVPQPIGGVALVVSVAAGDEHALALRNDGTVFAWGRNAEGQLGVGSTTRSLVPVAVPLPGIAIAIAAGRQHSLALLSDGRLFAWGGNADGAIGNGSNLNATSPVLVNAPFLGPIQSIGAGDTHSLALDALGVVWAWGDNSFMQLGDGTRTARNRPVVVRGLPVN
jgi:alpha-tubulin suppressor-like RCC1 family protein